MFVKYKFGFLKLLFLLISISASAQSPELGESMPHFELNDVNNYHLKRVSNADLKGKWYILDFWISGCAPCIAAFPKVSQMVAEFKGLVEIVQVGIGGNELKTFYNSLAKKQKLNIPMAFDTNLSQDWKILSYPTIFIVDPNGVLRVITGEISSEKLNWLVKDSKNEFADLSANFKKNQDKKESNLRNAFLIDGNGGEDTSYLYRSVLAKKPADQLPNGIANLNQIDEPGFPSIIRENLKKGIFQVSGLSLRDLYNVAYFGQDRFMYGDSLYTNARWFWTADNSTPLPVLEIKDSTDFISRDKKLVTYTYSISVPKEKATRAFMMRSIQLDLQKNFGYEVKTEKWVGPALKLVVVDKDLVAKLKNMGAAYESGNYNDAMDHKWVNVQSSFILSRLWGKNQFKPVTFMDETGLKEKIDIHLNCNLKDLRAVKYELQKHGFDLIGGEKEMKVLVISDPEPSKISSGQVLQTN